LMLHFSETKWWLSKVPICLSVVERFVSGIAATRTDRMPLAKSLILQIAGRHCYDEVKLCLVLGEKDIEELDFCWWLPHVFSDDKTVRYIATNYAESKELSSVLGGIFETRKEMSESKLEDENPYYVIICLDKDLAAKTEVVRRVLDCKKNIKFSVLSMFESLVDLPKECSAVVEVGASGSLTLIGEGSGQPMTFNLDELNNIDYDRIAAVLANNSVPSRSTYSLPSKYTFFEMIDLGMIEHLNLLESWASHDPTESLAVPVGVDSHGDLLNLNLHEKAHGPHGLVAGMTGSGKSEFIMAYILSLAVSFHPYEVAFILIDYKGGGMAKPFENIPHTAGIITNLDGNGIKRSLASLKSELHRRERIFESASSASHTSNIDIYKYQKLYREGKVREPLPHLIIISDEFAELKKEQGEFMTELTSASRVGRSLGVHLILATQKPEGVVDDQINSNSRFRVCLKVQDTADSNAMLGHPDAAMLQGSGKFFLRVGIDEIYEAGQSAWAGAPYYPSQKTVKDRDDAITVIDTNGHPVAQANTNRFAHVANPEKQLDTVINYIKKSCKEEGIKTWKMWLDPIPPSIFVDDLSKSREIVKYKLDPVAGMYDDPGTQSQGVLTVPVSSGNTIVYGSQGSGKLMFIEAVCYSLAKDHFPDESNIYILDFDQETLTAFSDAPHVGDVILSHESEKVVNLLKLMVGKVSTRKKILSKFGGTLAQYNASVEKPEPSILVIINNYAAFSEIYEASLPEIAYLSREGPKYGITFLLACTGINNVKASIHQNFKNLYCLQLNSADEYSSVVGKTEGLTPEMLKGRGLVRLDGRKVVEFQTARATKEDPPNAFFKRFSKHLSSKYPGAAARRIPVLPEKVTEEFLASRVSVADIAKVPIAVEKATLDILSWNFATPVTLIMSLNQEWLDFTRCLATMASSRLGIRTIVLQPSADKPLKSSGKLEAYTTPESLVSVVKELFSLCLTRNNEYKDKLKEGKKPPTFEKVLVIIQSMSLLKASLELVKIPAAEMGAADDSHVNRLMMAMEKNAEAYGVYYVVAESSGKMRNHAIDKWNTIHAKATTGLWVGSGINSQYKFTISKKPTEYTQELPVGFGFSVINSTAVLVKFLESE
ncbi:MAG: type VII secretion protein EssC, partial [Clostridiales bacterium]|nr:type VII secretion protein EssC [Clostridiales bacterium]